MLCPEKAQYQNGHERGNMSVGNASPLGKVVSEETLVTIPEEFAAETTTIVVPIEPESEIIGTELTIDENGKPTRNTVQYMVIGRVLGVLGALFLAFPASRIIAAANYGYEPHFGNYFLVVISAILLTFGIFFAFPCCVPIIERFRSRFRDVTKGVPRLSVNIA